MPRRAKEKVDTTSVKSTTPPVDSDGFYVLPRDLLLEYRAKDAECRHAHLLLRVCTSELDMLLLKHPEIRQKMTDKASMIVESANKKNALLEVHQMIEVIFGIKITDIGIDDMTGRIHQLADGKLSAEGLRPALPEVKKRGRKPKVRTAT